MFLYLIREKQMCYQFYMKSQIQPIFHAFMFHFILNVNHYSFNSKTQLFSRTSRVITHYTEWKLTVLYFNFFPFLSYWKQMFRKYKGFNCIMSSSVWNFMPKGTYIRVLIIFKRLLEIRILFLAIPHNRKQIYA